MKNRALLLLFALMIAGFMLPFLSSSPNRIVTATGIDFFSVFGQTRRWLLLTPLLLLAAAIFVTPTRRVYLSTILAASLLIAAMLFVAGDYASQITKSGPALARVSFGGGFWLWVLLTWLTAPPVEPRPNSIEAEPRSTSRRSRLKVSRS